MGQKASRPANYSEHYNEKQTYQSESISYEERLIKDLNQKLVVNDTSSPLISLNSLATWESDVLSDPKNKLAINAFTNNGIDSIIRVTKQVNQDVYIFNNEVDIIGSPSYFNNQKSSGRCWIFSTCNVLRSFVIKKYNIENFQLSQSYLFFYDKLEKANFFLHQIIENADLDLDSRLSSFLFGLPVNDGGQWDMIINIIEKYGLIPVEVFPDSQLASNSSRLNYLINEKLREYGLILREKVAGGVSESEVNLIKAVFIKEIYNILALTLGIPPKPDDSFNWEFIDKKGKFHRIPTTPTKFYKEHVDFQVSDYFSIINDPRNEYDTLYTVDKLNNIVGGKKIEYINEPSKVLKQTAVRMIQNNEPVFFGSDVGKFSNTPSGILDTKQFDYKIGFNVSPSLNKKQRLQTGSSAMTHAMTLTGVHLDDNGLPVRWKVENSWGDSVGDKGYFVMTDDWFDEYVFQIVTSEKYAPSFVVDVWKGKDYSVLPYYDPMGSLA